MEVLLGQERFKQVQVTITSWEKRTILSFIGDRLLSYNGKLIHNMTVQEVADILSLLPNPCRLKLCRYSIPSQTKQERPRRPMSVDAESLFQHEKQNNNSPSAVSVRLFFPSTDNLPFSS